MTGAEWTGERKEKRQENESDVGRKEIEEKEQLKLTLVQDYIKEFCIINKYALIFN